MDTLQQQIRRAAWCLLRNQLWTSCTWSLWAGLMVTVAAILASKWWPLGVDVQIWAAGWWITGGLGGLLAGCVWAWLRRPTHLETALEIDLRYGLHERVSSAVGLPPASRATALGQALIHDAARRAEPLDVRARFRLPWSWHVALPLGTALLALVVTLLPARAGRDAVARASPQMRQSLEELRQRLARRKEQQRLEPTPLPEAAGLLAKFEKTLNELDSPDVERSEALVRLNNLSKELAEQREDRAASLKLREQLRQLQGLQQGPADLAAAALQAGDLAQAGHELRELSDKLRRDELATGQPEELARQLQELAQGVDQMLDARSELQRQLRELEQKVRQLEQQGDRAAAGQLQQKLDQQRRQLAGLDAQNPHLEHLQELARQIQDGADAVRDGQASQAADRMSQVAADLERAQQDIKTAELADALQREISNTKNAMHCDHCGGQGCEDCQSPAEAVAVRAPDLRSDQPGRGLDSGSGLGARPEAETPTDGYRTRVGAEPHPGESVRSGETSGPNLPGTPQESIQQEIATALGTDPDPLVQQRLPRHEREQSKEYFELLRKKGALE